MGLIEKIFAIVMIPFGALIILERMEIFSLELSFDIVLVGAGLMIVLQIWSLLMGLMVNKTLSIMSVVIAIVFILPGVVYFLGLYSEIISLVLAVMMIIEALYALH